MVEVKDLYYRYESNSEYVLKDLNFVINRGEFVFLVGASGAGKSTLLKLIIREVVPSKGSITVFGQDLKTIPRWRVPYLRRNIGMVFQDFRLIENWSAFDNVAFALRVTGASSRDIKRRVPQILDMVGLAAKARTSVCNLSGGEQQRVGVARAIVNRPAMIIADEPTGNLDPETSLDIMNLLRMINIRGTTLMVATHNQAIVDRFQKRVIYLQDGMITGDVEKGVYQRVF